MDISRLEKGGWEGWAWEGKDMDSVGSGGRFGNGRENAYSLENTTV